MNPDGTTTTPEEAAIKAGIELAAAALPKIVDLFSHLGSRDAVLAVLDSALEVARKKTDADLAAKHRGDPK